MGSAADAPAAAAPHDKQVRTQQPGMKRVQQFSETVLSLARREPCLVLVVALGAFLRLSRIGDFHNSYYTATTVSMLESGKNFLYAAFDPGGFVTVDKPPLAFWVDGISVALFGPQTWAVNLPQAVLGTLSIALLYFALRPVFGRLAAVLAALVLAVLPASVVIDSRNEPDALLMFLLTAASLCVVRAAQAKGTRAWLWLSAFALLMGLAFNTKMLVAFVPLPAFMLYYILATGGLKDRVALLSLGTRLAAAAAVLLVVAFSWATLIAFTPADKRPYVGSTQDNSVWTLIFKYNGLNRFDSPGGPRPPQGQVQGPGTPQVQQPAPGVPVPPGANPLQPQPPPSVPAPPGDRGLLGLFQGRLAEQLGWLLPAGIAGALALVIFTLPTLLFVSPGKALEVLRESRAATHSLLWVGWLATCVVVFGIADATTTHPYYLVGIGVPLAAAVGAGFSRTLAAARDGALPLVAIATGCAALVFWQANAAAGLQHDWVPAIAIVAVLAAAAILLSGAWHKAMGTALTKIAAVMALGAVLLVPAFVGYEAGGQVAGSGGPPRPGQRPPANPQAVQVQAVSRYIRARGDVGSRYMVAAASAREAAPYIIAGIPAVAVAGFSGRDPILTPEAFRRMAERGEVRHFLIEPGPSTGAPSPPGVQAPLPGTNPLGQPPPAGGVPQRLPGAVLPGPGSPGQGAIPTYVRTAWEDVSRAAGLPNGSLFHYRDG